MFSCNDEMIIVIRMECNKNSESFCYLVRLLKSITKWLFLFLVDCEIEWN